VENQRVLLQLDEEGEQSGRTVSPQQAFESKEESGVIYKTLIEKGYLDEQKLDYAKRVHSKLTGDRTLAQVLQELKFITHEQLEETLSRNKIELRIGEFLVELGLITNDDLDRAIGLQKQSGVKKTIGEVLVENGFIEEPSLMEVLSYQLGLPYYELEISLLNTRLLRRVPPKLYSVHQFLPVGRVEGKVTVAFVDPMNRESLDAAQKAFGKIRPVICSKTDLHEIVHAIEREAAPAGTSEPDEKSVSEAVNSILEAGIESNASDIHIEPMKDRIRVRFRLDGVLVHQRDLPVRMGPPITSHLKIMAKADPAERQNHQDGRIEFKAPQTGVSLDLAASFFVTVWGEKTVLRVPGRKGVLLSLNETGMWPKMLDRFKFDALDIPGGIVLIAGPRGSGKTTTLYSCINYLENVNTSIITVENPVDHSIDGVAQCSIDPKMNLSFEQSIEHALRQDPDIIAIGEISDHFSAHTCIEASLSGHKALSTLHCEDSIVGLIHLLNLNVEAFLISSTLTCVVAQRLLRKLCPSCSEDYTPQPVDMRRLGYSANDMKGAGFKAGRGCSQCHFTGYSGRVGVFEMLVLNEPVRGAILDKKSSWDMRRIATETAGLTTLLEDGIMKAAKGITTLEEVWRYVPHAGKPRPVLELSRLLGAEL